VRVWIDLANSPHVPLFRPVVERLEASGDEVLLTVRDHAQTLALARSAWPDVVVVGGESPAGRAAKAATIAGRAAALARFALRSRPDVAVSHGSYAQAVAARLARVPLVTMMDYEFQPANHLSFRLAKRVVVPELFPKDALRRFGARNGRVVTYSGFKEQLYLAGFRPDPSVRDQLGVDRGAVLAVMRPPPDGALYHRTVNDRFDEILDAALARPDVSVVLLPRGRAQGARYAALDGVTVPAAPVDGSSLVGVADLVVGAGGTMNREAALLGTPTYTVFAGRLAAVDATLIGLGKLHDLRAPGSLPSFAPRRAPAVPVPEERRERIVQDLLDAAASVARRRRRRPAGADAVTTPA
jgi:predicted glycosyltransferase